MIDLTNAGPVIGEAITDAVGIPVIGGMGGGPWLDGRIRMFHAAVGYGTKFLDNPPSAYAYTRPDEPGRGDRVAWRYPIRKTDQGRSW